MRYHFIPIVGPKMRNSGNINSWQKLEERKNPVPYCWESRLVQPIQEEYGGAQIQYENMQ